MYKLLYLLLLSDSFFKSIKNHTHFVWSSSLLFWCSDRGTTLKLRSEAWELMIHCEVFWDFLGLGQKVSWKNMADSETQPGEPERGVFCLLGRKKLHLCDICKSTGKRNPFTTSRLWKGIKILTITFWVAVPSSLEKAFKRQSQKQRRISTIKPWKVQGGTLISIKQCILWLRTRLLLITLFQ